MTPVQWLMLLAALAACGAWVYWQSKRVPDIAGRREAWAREAQLLAHTHQMQAEHHQALADMYARRAERLDVSAEPESPVDDKAHPRFIAGYDAGMRDANLDGPVGLWKSSGPHAS